MVQGLTLFVSENKKSQNHEKPENLKIWEIRKIKQFMGISMTFRSGSIKQIMYKYTATNRNRCQLATNNNHH